MEIVEIKSVREAKLTYNQKINPAQLVQVKSSDNAFKYLKTIYQELIYDREMFVVLFLNRANKVTGHFVASIGGCTATVVDPKLVFTSALKHGAMQLILAHNHPSGNCMPSEQDKILTKNLVDGGKILEIKILDHIILAGEENYFSFADDNLIN